MSPMLVGRIRMAEEGVFVLELPVAVVSPSPYFRGGSLLGAQQRRRCPERCNAL